MNMHYRSIPFSCIVVILFSTYLLAWPPDTLWTVTYGGIDDDMGNAVIQIADSSYIIAGTTASMGNGTFDGLLLKIDKDGDTLWSKTYGGADHDYFDDIHSNPDGGYFIGGSTKSFAVGGFDFWLVVTDSSGDTLWTKTYGSQFDDMVVEVQKTSDNGYVIVGHTCYPTGANWDVYIVKTDENGDTLWTKRYGGANDDWGYSVKQTNDGGYIVVGKTKSFGIGNGDVWLLKTDTLGDTIWTKTYGGNSQYEEGRSVLLSSDHGFIIAGSTDSSGTGDIDFWLIKTDSLGNAVWARTYGGPLNDVCYSLRQTQDYGYIMTGSTCSFSGGEYDIWLVRTDVWGTLLWSCVFGGADYDVAWDLCCTYDGGYAIIGETESYGLGLRDVYLIKTAEDDYGILEQIVYTNIDARVSIRPNPFTDQTNIGFQAVSGGEELTIYTVAGRLARTFQIRKTSVLNKSSISWDGRDNSNNCLPGGVYFLKFKDGSYSETHKLILLR